MTNKKNKHLTDRQLIDYIEGTIMPKKQRIYKSHIESCDSCSREYIMLKKIWDPKPTIERMSPDPQVLDKIILEYDKISNRNKWFANAARIPGTFFKSYRKIAISAMIAMAAVSIFFFAWFLNQPKITGFQEIKLHAMEFHGKVLFNKIETTSPFYFSSGDTIDTDRSSEVKITYNPGLKMILKEGSNLTISNSQKHIQKKKNIFDFIMKNGSLKCEFNPKTILSYSFTTPHAVIRSGGTIFNLNVKNKITTLTVEEGSLLVFSKDDSGTLKEKAIKGNTYTIGSNGEVKKEKTLDEKSKFNKKKNNY